MLGRNMLSMSGLSLYRNVVQFGMNVMLAAFVTPGEYGLVVFTAPFLVLIAMLTDLGMTAAIVRAPTLSRREAGAAFGVTMLGASVGAALLAAAAWPLERVIAMPGLAPVMTAMAGVVLLSVGAATPRALLERQLRYGRIATIEASATAAAAVVGLAAAWGGAGIWALILYNGLTQLMRLVAFGWLARTGLAPNLAFGEVSRLLAFGGWVLATNLLNFLARNSDNLLIGAWLGAAAVGVYGLSYQFMIAPLMAITWPTSGILLATLRDNNPHGPEAQAMVQGVLSVTATASVPAMAFLTFGLHFPAAAMLSPRWQSVPEIVAWLGPAGALQSVASYNGALLMAAGRARAQFMLTVVNTAVLLSTFVLALPFGLMTLVKAYVAVITLSSVAFLTMIVMLTGLRWRDLARALAPAVGGTAVGIAAVAGTTGFALASWIEWIMATAIYGGGVLAVYLLFRGELHRTFQVLTHRAAPATGT